MEEMMNRTFFSVSAFVMLAISATHVYAAEWNVSLWGKRRAFTEHVHKLAELVDKKTNGSLKLKISYGGLSKARENLDNISFGAFEMAQFCASYHEDKNPSITVLELPFLGVTSLEQEARISMAVYKHPAVKKDLARWNATLLMPTPLPQYNIAGIGKPPKTLKDFRGMSIRATGGIGNAMGAIGAVPTSMGAAEVRQALDSGVIKAVAFAPHAHISFGTVEIVKWWTTNLNPGTVNCPVVVNTDALISLNDTERKALTSSVDEAIKHYISYYNENTMKKWWPVLEKKKVEQITYNAENLEAFRLGIAGPAAAAWVKDNNRRGLPAQDLLNLVREELAK
ncbi:MAG: C4-dicarboxylate TRAP transporter substrate-binding protein [Hyphomicrobiaceae bacterium]|nr:C4-dicarboxylate TRAP transporter substrate-binding protein [Hyphomicrobiaceae bacterium]